MVFVQLHMIVGTPSTFFPRSAKPSKWGSVYANMFGSEVFLLPVRVVVPAHLQLC